MTNNDPVAINRKRAAWAERAEIARAQKQPDVEQAALKIVAAYEAMLKNNTPEPEACTKANSLRKQIEAAEMHRTMSAEHGLNDEAIDVTYEIQKLEQQVVELVRQLT